jgi:hypothetical protein
VIALGAFVAAVAGASFVLIRGAGAALRAVRSLSDQLRFVTADTNAKATAVEARTAGLERSAERLAGEANRLQASLAQLDTLLSATRDVRTALTTVRRLAPRK